MVARIIKLRYITDALNTVEDGVVLLPVVISQPATNMNNVSTIGLEKNVLNLVVVIILLVDIIDVRGTEEEEDVKNQIVKKVR
ncbi:hypothetical protein EBV26_11300 [bacterium]|nr:hypothetical protein [bacterium]